MTRKASLGLWLAFCVLGVAIGFQWLQVRDLSAGDMASERAVGFLANKVPGTITGWEGKDMPLGDTELIRGKVATELNYDDFVYRVFSRGSSHIGIYVAYWKRDRMPVSRVASHTPDRCWSTNGWTCESMNFNEVWTIAGEMLQPTQRRVFSSSTNIRENVAFWHLVNGKAFDFGERSTMFTHPGKWIRDTVAYAAMGSNEQYFVRLTSDRPFEEFKGDAGWDELIKALAKLGLAESAPASGKI